MAPTARKAKEGDAVWLRGAKGEKPFVPGKVTKIQQEGARLTVLRTESNQEETLEASKADIFPANEAGLKTNDHCALIHLNEPCVLENTRARLPPPPLPPAL